jgi:amino acid permease
MSSKVMQIGIPVSLVLLVVLAVLTHFSIRFLTQACDHTGVYCYDELASSLFGKPFAIILGLAMFINCFGAAIVYIIGIGDALHVVFEWPTSISTTVISVFLLSPLGCVYEINKLRYFSFAGVIGVVLLAVATAYALGILGVSESIKVNPRKIWTGGELKSLINAFSSVTFAYANQYNVPHIYEELTDRSVAKMAGVSIRSLLMSITLYVTAAICGFLAFGYSLKGEHANLMNNFEGMVNDKHYLVIVAILGCTLSLCVAHPLHILPMRQTVEFLFSRKNPKWKGSRALAIVTGVILVLSTLICAICYRKLPEVIDLVGALAGSIICYIGPSAFALKIAKDRGESILRAKYIGHHLMFIGGILVGVLGTISAIYTMVKSK